MEHWVLHTTEILDSEFRAESSYWLNYFSIAAITEPHELSGLRHKFVF